MTKVFVQLLGDRLDIEELQNSLKSNNWTITEEDNKFYLTSPTLDVITNHWEIIFKANEFLDILNGAANILYMHHYEVTTGNLK